MEGGIKRCGVLKQTSTGQVDPFPLLLLTVARCFQLEVWQHRSSDTYSTCSWKGMVPNYLTFTVDRTPVLIWDLKQGHLCKAHWINYPNIFPRERRHPGHLVLVQTELLSLLFYIVGWCLTCLVLPTPSCCRIHALAKLWSPWAGTPMIQLYISPWGSVHAYKLKLEMHAESKHISNVGMIW